MPNEKNELVEALLKAAPSGGRDTRYVFQQAWGGGVSSERKHPVWLPYTGVTLTWSPYKIGNVVFEGGKLDIPLSEYDFKAIWEDPKSKTAVKIEGAIPAILRGLDAYVPPAARARADLPAAVRAETPVYVWIDNPMELAKRLSEAVFGVKKEVGGEVKTLPSAFMKAFTDAFGEYYEEAEGKAHGPVTALGEATRALGFDRDTALDIASTIFYNTLVSYLANMPKQVWKLDTSDPQAFAEQLKAIHEEIFNVAQEAYKTALTAYRQYLAKWREAVDRVMRGQWLSPEEGVASDDPFIATDWLKKREQPDPETGWTYEPKQVQDAPLYNVLGYPIPLGYMKYFVSRYTSKLNDLLEIISRAMSGDWLAKQYPQEAGEAPGLSAEVLQTAPLKSELESAKEWINKIKGLPAYTFLPSVLKAVVTDIESTIDKLLQGGHAIPWALKDLNTELASMYASLANMSEKLPLKETGETAAV